MSDRDARFPGESAAGAPDRRGLLVELRGFLTGWALPKALFFAWLTVLSLWLGIHWATGAALPFWVESGAFLVLFLCAWYWLRHEARRFPAITAEYGGFALYVLWWLVLPMYVLETRGWRRALVIYGFTLLLIATGLVLGAVVGTAVPTSGS